MFFRNLGAQGTFYISKGHFLHLKHFKRALFASQKEHFLNLKVEKGPFLRCKKCSSRTRGTRAQGTFYVSKGHFLHLRRALFTSQKGTFYISKGHFLHLKRGIFYISKGAFFTSQKGFEGWKVPLFRCIKFSSGTRGTGHFLYLKSWRLKSLSAPFWDVKSARTRGTRTQGTFHNSKRHFLHLRLKKTHFTGAHATFYISEGHFLHLKHVKKALFTSQTCQKGTFYISFLKSGTFSTLKVEKVPLLRWKRVFLRWKMAFLRCKNVLPEPGGIWEQGT